jgi:hypothetical protein
LFCAFQPKRLIVPSLPLRLNSREMPYGFEPPVSRSVSSMFSIRPAPKTGVGMRKMMLLCRIADAKFGYEITEAVQLVASVRPAMV